MGTKKNRVHRKSWRQKNVAEKTSPKKNDFTIRI